MYGLIVKTDYCVVIFRYVTVVVINNTGKEGLYCILQKSDTQNVRVDCESGLLPGSLRPYIVIHLITV